MVGRGGNAPPKPEGKRFTVSPVILSGTYQFKMVLQGGFEPPTPNL